MFIRSTKRKSLNKKVICGLAITICSFTIISSSAYASESDLDIALAIADLLRAARSEVANQQPLINDPSTDKNLTGDKLVELVRARLSESDNDDLLELDDDSRQDKLIKAQLASIREVIDENQNVINRSGVEFKGFVPAVFTRLVNERFAEKVGSQAKVKVTAPLELVRNRKSRPDKWERSVIEDRFSSVDWNRGQLFSEQADVSGKTAFRVMVPEYYGNACLSCHGNPKGEMDITGYPMEGGEVGDLGGAISISLFK